MNQTLQLIFTQEKRTKTLSLENPSADLSKEKIQSVMSSIVEKGALLHKGKPVDGIKDAYIKAIHITPLH